MTQKGGNNIVKLFGNIYHNEYQWYVIINNLL